MMIQLIEKLSIFLILTSSCSPQFEETKEEKEATIQQICFTGQKIFDEELIEYGQMCLNQLCSFEYAGRKAGTAGWEKAYDFLLSEITEMGYEPQSQTFQTEKGTQISNIIVTIPGSIDSTVVVGAHFDGAQQSLDSRHYPAANDNASGTVAQLLLLKSLSENTLNTDRTIKICFWGCEEVFEEKAFRGSLHYTHNLYADELALLLLYINIDTVGHQLEENVVSLNHSGEKRVEIAALRTESTGHFNYAVSKRTTNLVSDYYSFFLIGIPFLNYHDHCGDACAHRLHTTQDIPEAISIERLYKVMCDIRNNIETY